MNRSKVIDRISTVEFDVVIIGGGITGAGIFRDCVYKGLRTVLIEKGDFASGTSSRSGKLIHGGLRYLRYGHIKLVWESCQERVLLMRKVAPHIVRPVRFSYPFYHFSKTPMWLVALGLFFYDLLSLFRNIKPFRKLREIEWAKSLGPLLSRDGIKGVLSYYDGFCPDFRLVIDTLKDGVSQGGELLNYCEYESSIYSPEGWAISCLDHINHRKIIINSKTIINASGAWADEVIKRSGGVQKFKLKLTEGIHLIISNEKLKLEDTLAMESPDDGRNLYMIPWADKVLVGTTDKVHSGNADQLKVSKSQEEYLLRALNRYFPKAQINSKDILARTIGVRPLIGSDQGVREEKIPRDFQIIIDARGMVSITGGKLTTYRKMASHATEALVEKFFGQKEFKNKSTESPISGGNVHSKSEDEFLKKVSERGLKVSGSEFSQLFNRYGSNAYHILDIGLTDQDFKMLEKTKLCSAEIKYIIRNEWALTLSDLFFRRTTVYYQAENYGMEELSEVLNVFKDEFNLKDVEIERLRQNYILEVNDLNNKEG